MTGAGIQDGDLLIVDKAAEVTSGCIVVARVHDEFTLKRVRKEGNRVFLVPENDRYPTLEITAGQRLRDLGTRHRQRAGILTAIFDTSR
jgi:DNA polymerase V